MTVSVRPARETDVASVLRFTHELAEHEGDASEVAATREQMLEALFGPSPAAEALIAEKDGDTVGFAVFFPTFSTWTGRRGMWLDDLYVTPHARGSGAGTQLLRALAAICLERDCARLEWFVLNTNDTAITYYDSLGAQRIDQRQPRRIAGNALRSLANSCTTAVPESTTTWSRVDDSRISRRPWSG